jgi:hypothetical protein
MSFARHANSLAGDQPLNIFRGEPQHEELMVGKLDDSVVQVFGLFGLWTGTLEMWTPLLFGRACAVGMAVALLNVRSCLRRISVSMRAVMES